MTPRFNPGVVHEIGLPHKKPCSSNYETLLGREEEAASLKAGLDRIVGVETAGEGFVEGTGRDGFSPEVDAKSLKAFVESRTVIETSEMAELMEDDIVPELGSQPYQIDIQIDISL